MDIFFKNFITQRKSMLMMINKLSVKQLNEIPEGFNNNIIWNIAHLTVTQQLLCYKLSGNKIKVSDNWVSSYMKGTKPDAFVKEEEILKIKEEFISTITETQEDYHKGLFTKYKAYTTSVGVELISIDIALNFLIFHEGIHLGSIMALKRFIKE
ncbi:MAG: DinB family protein [Flavobacteriaceae bacterium]|nr:DinB family protein [Flavobacteriaceae bacterium]